MTIKEAGASWAKSRAVTSQLPRLTRLSGSLLKKILARTFMDAEPQLFSFEHITRFSDIAFTIDGHIVIGNSGASLRQGRSSKGRRWSGCKERRSGADLVILLITEADWGTRGAGALSCAPHKCRPLRKSQELAKNQEAVIVKLT